MQWQHGTYTINTNGSLSLTPFAVDGRQLLSEPCQADTSTYTRYNQSETFEVCCTAYSVAPSPSPSLLTFPPLVRFSCFSQTNTMLFPHQH